MPGDTPNTTPADRPLEVLLSLPRTDLNVVQGLTPAETQALADATGQTISTHLPGGRFLCLHPEPVDDPDRLDYGPAA